MIGAMKRPLVLSLLLVLVPVMAAAQTAPMPEAAGGPMITPQQRAAMTQMRAQVEAARSQTRAAIIAALSPGHRAQVANMFGQLALTANPNPRAAAQALDAVLAPGEKQAIVNIATTERANMRALMQQQRAAFESTLNADERARMAQRDAKRQAFMQSNPRAAHVPDPGAIVLRTLGNFGAMDGPGGMHGRPI